MIQRPPDLTRVQKVAIFLTALGAEGAANVLRHFPEPQAVGILQEIADLHALDEPTVRQVLTEFQAGTDEVLRLRMGPEYASLLIQKSFNGQEAKRLMARVDRQLTPPPFAELAGLPAADLAALLADESDQTAALVLAFLPADTAAEVLPLWSAGRAAEVGRRIMGMDTGMTVQVAAIEEGLLAKHARLAISPAAETPRRLAEILANVQDTAAERILSALGQARPDLAESLRSQLTTFHDIRHLTDAALRLLFTRVGLEDWAMALKGAPGEVREVVERNLSTRAKERLAETMDLLGPQPRRLVDDARARVLQAVKQAEAAGELVFRRGADEIIP
jgi:flagellar motor switch protein FliG